MKSPEQPSLAIVPNGTLCDLALERAIKSPPYQPTDPERELAAAKYDELVLFAIGRHFPTIEENSYISVGLGDTPFVVKGLEALYAQIADDKAVDENVRNIALHTSRLFIVASEITVALATEDPEEQRQRIEDITLGIGKDEQFSPEDKDKILATIGDVLSTVS